MPLTVVLQGAMEWGQQVNRTEIEMGKMATTNFWNKHIRFKYPMPTTHCINGWADVRRSLHHCFPLSSSSRAMAMRFRSKALWVQQTETRNNSAFTTQSFRLSFSFTVPTINPLQRKLMRRLNVISSSFSHKLLTIFLSPSPIEKRNNVVETVLLSHPIYCSRILHRDLSSVQRRSRNAVKCN